MTPVPDDVLAMFARSEAGRCTVAFTPDEVRVTSRDGTRTKSIARPCTLAEVDALAKEVRK
jgi:hypothetical protein